MGNPMRISRLQRIALLSGLLLVTAPMRAQNRSCDVPLVVTRFAPESRTVEQVSGLRPEDLSVQLAGTAIVPEAVGVDDGPKRVAIVLDASLKVPRDEWKMATTMAQSLLLHARTSDRFIIVVTGEDVAQNPFLSPGEAIQKVNELQELPQRSAGADEKVYDALDRAAAYLTPPKFGDAIFLFGHNEDSGSKMTPDQVRDLILQNEIRFYALGFYDPLQGKLPPGFDLNKPLPADLRQSHLEEISANTGYFFSFHSLRSLAYPGQTELLRSFLSDLYAGIAAPYRVTIPVSSAARRAPLSIAVKRMKEMGIHGGDVHYPKVIYSCSSRMQPQ